jgi:hypothetical protein
MRITPQRPTILLLRSTANTIRNSRSLLRLVILIGVVSISGVTLGSTSSSASVFSPLLARAAAIFGRGQTTDARAANTNLALHAEEASEPLAPSATMSVERRGHTATRLSDGRVLIAGGENSSGALNESELYDPATSEFTTAGNMNEARADHTATLLSDGRVLIAGGRNGAGAVATTEIFDPATGTFSSGPNMSVARAGHSATLFADGRILFAGGDGSGSAEILDASLSSSTAVGSMGTARSKHSAALLLDGRVLIVGGRDASGNDLTTGEILDGSTFSAIDGNLTVARSGALLRVLFDGKVQIIGGSNDGSMEIYDPSIETFGAYAHVLPEGDTCASLPSQIQAAQTRAALFHNGQSDPTFDRTSHSITELTGQAIVVGGANSAGSVLSSTPLFASSNAAISTDKLDYAPGETAHITGRGFRAGETVRVRIHEDPHTPQERGMDVVADGDGSFVGDYLVQDYDLSMKFIVGARGLTSGLTAQTTFTDGAVRVKTFGTGGTPANVDWAKYSSSNCTGAAVSFGTISAVTTGSGTDIPGGTSSGSLLLTAQSVSGYSFVNWSGGIGPLTSPNAANPICVVHQNGTRNIDLTYSAANAAPVAGAVSISGTAQYAQLLTGNYTYSDADGDAQGTSTFRWLRDGITTVGTNQTYTAVGADVGHTLTFEVTPVAATGTSPGTAVQSAAVTINKADAICTIIGYTGIYDTNPHGATGSCTGVDAGGSAAGSTLDLGATFTNVPGGTANWSFTGGSNYNDQNGSVAIVINKADAVCTINGYTGIYDGNPHGASGSCTGVDTGGAAAGSTLDLGATFTNVPGGTANWSFTGGTNYNNQNGSVAIVINKADAVCTISGYNGIYDGNPHGATGSCTGVDAGGSAAGSTLNLGASFTYVPGGTAHWTFTGGTNYLDESGDVSIVITTAYCFNGFLSPIGGSVETLNGGSFADPVRAFKLGSTVPVKFAINSWDGTTCGAPVITGIHLLQAIKYSNETEPGTAIDASPTDAATTGNQFRLTDSQWHFNMSTKGGGFSQGTWLLKATLQDGSTHTVWIAIKK